MLISFRPIIWLSFNPSAEYALGDVVDSAFKKRVAFQYPFYRQKRSEKRSVALNGFYCVGRTGRIEATAGF